MVVSIDIAPVLEVCKQSLSKHVTNNISSFCFICLVKFIGTIFVKLLSFGDCNVHVFFDGLLHECVLFGLCMLSEGIENVSGCEITICLTKRNSSHIHLHKLSVILHIILPRFEVGVENSLTVLFFDAGCDLPLIEYLS